MIKNKMVDRRDLPDCCVACSNHRWEATDDDYQSGYYHYCALGLIIPVRKESCKRYHPNQNKQRQEVEYTFKISKD